MFDIPSIRIGKVFGIPVEVNLSWVIVFALVSFTLATSYYPAIPQAVGTPGWVFGVLGAVTALLFFGSILAHELTHSMVTRAEGGRVDKITLFIFGGVAEMEQEPNMPAGHLASLFNAQGLPKTAFFAYRFLNQLHPTQLRCDDPRVMLPPKNAIPLPSFPWVCPSSSDRAPTAGTWRCPLRTSPRPPGSDTASRPRWTPPEL